MEKFCYPLLLSLMMLCTAQDLQAGTVDLELTLMHNIPDDIQFGDSGDFSVTLTNRGPDDAGADSIAESPNVISSGVIQLSELDLIEVSFTSASSSSDCTFFASIGEPLPGQGPIFNYSFYLPVIPAGSSITCHGRYHIGFASGEVTVNWEVYNFSDQDTDISNNTVPMVFKILPPKVPTLNQLGMMFMVLLVIAVADFRFRQRRS